MFTEEELIPISALQHWIFCPRQCALIHLEQVWAENRWTVEGQTLHKNADSKKQITRDGVRSVSALPLRSLEWGLVGQADVVEFSSDSITPVEYKRGKPKKNDCDTVQLCAQALCLEEMCGRSILRGALFYGKRKRRTVIEFDPELRRRTTEVIEGLRDMLVSKRTPAAVKEPKCKECSLIELCLPSATESNRNVARFFQRQLSAHASIDFPEEDEDDWDQE